MKNSQKVWLDNTMNQYVDMVKKRSEPLFIVRRSPEKFFDINTPVRNSVDAIIQRAAERESKRRALETDRFLLGIYPVDK